VSAKRCRRRHSHPFPVEHGFRFVSGGLRIVDIVGYPSAAGAAVWPKAAWPLVITIDRREAQNTAFVISAKLEHSPLSFGWKKGAFNE